MSTKPPQAESSKPKKVVEAVEPTTVPPSGSDLSKQAPTSVNKVDEKKHTVKTGGRKTPPPRSNQPPPYHGFPPQPPLAQGQHSAAQQMGYYYQQQPNYQTQLQATSGDSSHTNSSGSHDVPGAFVPQYQQPSMGGSPFLGSTGYGHSVPQQSTGNSHGSPSLQPQSVGVEGTGSPPLSPYFLPAQPSVAGASTAAVSSMISQGAYGGNGSSTPYGNTAPKSNSSSSPSLEQSSWGESGRTFQQGVGGYPQASQQASVPSPQLHGSVGVPLSYTSQQTQSNQAYAGRMNPNRSQSLEDMLPPPAIGDQHPHDHNLPGSCFTVGGYYSSGSNVANGVHSGPPAAGGGTMFAHHPWYGAGLLPDMYTAEQQRLNQQPPMGSLGYPTMGGASVGNTRHHQMAPYYPNVPSTPGPPIQTTASNKGPDGANLFIFHIPNHFTNQDMYHLFFPYGNVISVRIMVEPDTGRSRGFGFVSYDSPESAAHAIKELNGYVIGNKRLKVQHKQIRSAESRRNPISSSTPRNGGHENDDGTHERSNSSPLDSSQLNGRRPEKHGLPAETKEPKTVGDETAEHQENSQLNEASLAEASGASKEMRRKAPQDHSDSVPAQERKTRSIDSSGGSLSLNLDSIRSALSDLSR